MNWLLISVLIYVAVLLWVCFRIIYDTITSVKALGYLLLVIFFPVAGMIFYFSFGVNHRLRKIYSKKLSRDSDLAKRANEEMLQYSRQNFENGGPAIHPYKELSYMLAKGSGSFLTANNAVKLLINGESKFPEVLQALQEAKNYIHIEYYIYEDGEIGRAIEQLLIAKVKEGVTVRFIYDDFGSRSIRKNVVSRLQAAGIQAFPFYEITFRVLGARLNYRNHRKIIVVDGYVAFVGGINVSDRYVNKPGIQQLFWRDTHLRIEGPGVLNLQYLFLCDWNFCADDNLEFNALYFPKPSAFPIKGNKLVQIASSGPDSDTPTILFSLLQAINLATKEILISTPYFIPGESILNALILSSMGGVIVKLLVPGVSDSILVNAAARSYYGELLNAGVEIYRYTKGFVHAKTLVADRTLSVIGTANMDARSFELNFEVNAIVYDEELAGNLANIFYEDIKNAEKIDATTWASRPRHKQLMEKTARLVSPLL